jgi:methionyl-tRNA formyltransferase
MRPEIVLTQPDRPAGRGRRLRASAVKQLAIDAGIALEQPATLRSADAQAMLETYRLDVLIVAAYGLLLPQSVLDIPRLGCINVHASLLPRWRGAAPIPWAIASGDERTGVCLMQMEAGLDTGPVIACRDTAIGATDTAGDLHDRLAAMGGELLADCLPDILNGDVSATPQRDELATYARKLTRDDGRLDWRLPAAEVDRRIRAFNPYPGCVTWLGDEPLKCWRSHLSRDPLPEGAAPGALLGESEGGMAVAAGDGVVCVTEVQRPGRRRIAATEFMRQHDLAGQAFRDGA